MIESSKRSYSNGRIYCIRNNVNDDVYVGSTTQPLSQRFQKHKCDLKNPKKNNFKFYQYMNELGEQNFYIELIEEYPCENIEQLRRKEGEWIRKMATLNTKIAGRTTREYYEEHLEDKKEYDKLYHEENKDKRSKQAKERYEKDKERIKQRVHDRYYREKDKIKEYTKQTLECPCGVKFLILNKSRHLKSKHHQNYEKSLHED